MWSLETFECIKVLEGHSDNIYCLELNSNDSFLSCSEHQTVKSWQIEQGELLNSIEYDQPVNNVKRLTEDLVAIALENGEIQIYDLNKMENVHSISAHSSFVNRISLLQNGNLFSGSEDGNIKLWEFL